MSAEFSSSEYGGISDFSDEAFGRRAHQLDVELRKKVYPVAIEDFERIQRQLAEPSSELPEVFTTINRETMQDAHALFRHCQIVLMHEEAELILTAEGWYS